MATSRTTGATATEPQVIEQLPARVDLYLYQGDDLYLHVKLDNSQVPIDLTPYTPSAQVRAKPGAAELVATFDATVLDPTTIALHLPSVESTKLPSSSSWDVQIVDTAGVVLTLAYGTVTASREVTT